MPKIKNRLVHLQAKDEDLQVWKRLGFPPPKDVPVGIKLKQLLRPAKVRETASYKPKTLDISPQVRARLQDIVLVLTLTGHF